MMVAWIRWFGLVAFSCFVLFTGYVASRQPWHWDPAQDLFMFLALCLLVTTARWLYLWRRGGTAEVRERWQNGINEPIDKKVFARRVAILVGAGMALAVVLGVVRALTQN